MSSRHRKGSAILEFAIGSTVMIAIFAGTFQFGFTFYRYNSMYNAVRSAAQYASLRAYDSGSSTPSSAFRTAVANMAVYGSPAGGSAPVVPGLTTDKINLTVVFDRQIPVTMTVSVTSFGVDAVFKSYSFTGKPSLTFPYLGRYSPP